MFAKGTGSIQLYTKPVVPPIPATPTFSLPFGSSPLPTTDVYGSTLTPNDAPTIYQDGTRGYVLATGAAGALISSYSLTQTYTKSAWVYITQTQTHGSIVACISDGFIDFHTMYIDGTTLYEQNSSIGAIAGPTIPLNTWVHCASTYNPSTNTLKIYKNGILAVTYTLTGGGVSASLPFYGGGQIVIGESGTRDFMDPTIIYYGNPLVNSYVDNVILYNRVLSDAEVLALYQNTLANP